MLFTGNEKRKGLRQRANGMTNAYVYYQGKRLHKGIVQNISNKDVYVKSNSLAIPLGAVIQLVFSIEIGNVVKTHRKSAIITRIGKDDKCFACSFIKRKQRK